MPLHPPRPVLTVRVGVSGHRWGEKLDRAHAAAIHVRLREALDAVREIAERFAGHPGSGYRQPAARPDTPPGEAEPPCRLRLVSALAEGSDRLLAEAGSAAGPWRLSAILPFDPAQYARDATDPGSAAELDRLLQRARAQDGVVVLDGQRDAPNAFGPVGLAVCLNSDVLIAVWNGLPGKPGGTAEVVEAAVRVGIPVIRVSPSGEGHPWIHRPDARDHGESEGLLHLEERMRRLFLPPVPPADADREERAHFEHLDLREEYFAESRRGWLRGRGYGFLLRLLAFSWTDPRGWWRELWAGGGPLPRRAPRDPAEAMRARWRRRWRDELQLEPECVEPIIGSTLAAHQGWASHLAAYYAGRYRNAFLVGYMLSWVAVGFAATGLATSALLLWVPTSTLVTAVGEFGVILVVLLSVWVARRNRHHERWLAYRSLAEGFRTLTFTLPFARPSALDASGGYGAETWVDWMQRAVVREIGLPPMVMTHGHLIQARKLLVEDVLAEQIAYHHRTATTLVGVERRLQWWARVLFFLALVLSAMHLWEALHLYGTNAGGMRLEQFKVVLNVVALIIPAAVAAAHGFMSQADFEGTAARSRATRRALERLRAASTAEGLPLTSEAWGDLAARIVEAMHLERGAWFAAYRQKAINYS